MNLKIEADFRDLLPPLSDDEFAQLKENLQANPDGFPAIVVWKNYKGGNVIVDGHHQYKARTALGLTVKVKKLDFEDRAAAMMFAVQCQLGRRNSTAASLAAVAGRLRINAHLPTEEAAKAVGISKRTVEQFDAIQRDGSEPLKKAVVENKVSVSDGAAILDKPKAEQTAAVKAVKEGKAKTVRAAAKESAVEKTDDREWGNGDSLDDVQADLKELARRCRELSKFARMILQCEENDPTRPYCSNYSLLTISHPLLHVARCVANDMPVGGTPKKPILYHEEKAASLAK